MAIISNTCKYIPTQVQKKITRKVPNFPKMAKNVGSLQKKWEKRRDAFILKLALSHTFIIEPHLVLKHISYINTGVEKKAYTERYTRAYAG